jgi:hypothetical protein
VAIATALDGDAAGARLAIIGDQVFGSLRCPELLAALQTDADYISALGSRKTTANRGWELSWAGIESHTEEKTVTIVL